MRIEKLTIKNFRGISEAEIYFSGHTVLIGDNNAGKTTILEAIDLVLGPDRINRVPTIDEHDFFNGKYLEIDSNKPEIAIEIVITDLNDSQKNRFNDNIEFWNSVLDMIVDTGGINLIDKKFISPALRVKFVGHYDEEEDDFIGNTFFCWPENASGNYTPFSKSDKRECGFLYLRALRTGSRALSLERGSLLDIILRIKEIRPKMWESILSQLRSTEVADEPEVGIKDILVNVQSALKEFVPSDWGSEPIFRVSDLTREHLRRTLTIFMSTGKGTYHAPFQHQGTGTINTTVLALLSLIADSKNNVIFAMEEPEIAIPPYTQKRIIDSVRKKSTQAIFTSHSPYVLEEFPPEQIILINRSENGKVQSQSINFPKNIKPKSYSSEFRQRFSEALLAKRILLTEGTTEATVFASAGRRLNELLPMKYSSLESMGVAIFNVSSETAIASYGNYFRGLGKIVFAVFDKQDSLFDIESSVDFPFESPFKGFEDLVIQETDSEIIKEFYKQLITNDEWPSSLESSKVHDDSPEAYGRAIKKYLIKNKGAYSASDMIGLCKSATQIPKSIRKVLKEIKKVLESQSLQNNNDDE